ncbi:hypothetical protein B0I72DRAFT_134661 [Yarrowia lipolytica]|uniref:YALI0D02915p n=2 Tax=Yarrowia lipolytica TaxID=4952 RepID=Q6CAG6_YARLI|nr:YALI0D02915p [Yarrowia lipolytica CLIB122]AOW03506.1 hypothetical protein YALI1_D03718g [Yarrowia lipolytica]KAB8284716.1 hypothetical protein BKA91DRAFT_134758 [Yarrowia lipolytica]KAE8170636.1 hypothetical protein BKA90DRAFT_140500 [Yarrowia lipolytica]KAJ8054860.1 hypothetical protein LXG23DRAFT_36954 [Yarrowia lipolytica]QNP97620.1 Hypothetical protein YALI2_D00061g [Yarrowia lipolytica]|eukprot:XP_502346.1 YALI0D02915p [Yarrowia lipolytica CLIB122]
MFPKTPVAATSRKQASFRDENALLPGKSALDNGNPTKPASKNKQFVTPTQVTRRVPLGGKDVNKHNSGQSQSQLSQAQPQQSQLSQSQQLSHSQGLSHPQGLGHLKTGLHSTGRSSMRASARKRLQVRNDNAAPPAETKHVGLPRHLWATTEVELMPPKEPDAAPDVFEEWTLDDDILGDTDVLAPARGKRNSLDLDWDELDQLLPESPVNSKGGATSTPKRDHVPRNLPRNDVTRNVTQPVRAKSREASSSTSSVHVTGLPVKSKPIAKPFSRRPARAMVPSAQLRNKENVPRPAPASVTPVRSSTPSRIPVKKNSTPTASSTTPRKAAVTPVRPTHNFMNPTKSAEAKMRVKVETPTMNVTPNRASPRARGGRGSRMAFSDTLRPSPVESGVESGLEKSDGPDNRPTTADSNWSNITDPMDRFSFEED